MSDLVPTGLLYLAEACRRHGMSPLVVLLPEAARVIAEAEGGQWDDQRWRALMARLFDATRPQAVGIQCHWSYQTAGALAVARWVKSLDPGVHVTLGGVHAGATAGGLLAHSRDVDSVVIGEGDEAYPLFLRSLQGRRTTSPPGRSRIVGFPFVRGRCPRPCTFCWLNSSVLYPRGQSVLTQQLGSQLPLLLERRIPIYLPENDAGPVALGALADALERAGKARQVFADLNPGSVDTRVVAAVRRLRENAERTRVWLGVEAGSERVRRLGGRRYADSEILCGVDRLREVPGVPVQASVMVGLPGETDANLDATDRLVGALNRRGILANVLPCVAFPGTRLFKSSRAFRISLTMRTTADFERLSKGWFAPIASDTMSFRSGELDADARVEATLKLRLRQRVRMGYRVTPELFRMMEHLPGLRVPGETERMTEQFSRYLEGPRFGGPVRRTRFWSPEE